MILRFLKYNNKDEGVLAKRLLNAVWNENIVLASNVIRQGADPNWIYNGYPILLHAVFTRNEEMVMMLIQEGATQIAEALGFALDRGIGELILPLAFLGAIPKVEEPKGRFGAYPSRYAPIDLHYPILIN